MERKTTVLSAGFDFGNSHTKFKKGNTEICFESGYEAYLTKPWDKEAMEVDGMYLVFGKRAPVEYDKCASNRMLYCTLRCIVEYLDRVGADPAQEQFVNLGVDIPINLYGTQKADYETYYKDKFCIVTYKEKEWKIRFQTVKAYPQGAVIYMANAKTYEKYQTLVLLDIGGRTVDVAVVVKERGRARFQKKFSLQKGILTLVGDIDKALQVEGIQLTESQIESLISGEELPHRRFKEIEAIVNLHANSYTADLVNAMYENGIDKDLAIVLAGGGGDLIRNHIGEQLYIIENAGNMANAGACEKALNTALSREQEVDA